LSGFTALVPAKVRTSARVQHRGRRVQPSVMIALVGDEGVVGTVEPCVAPFDSGVPP